MIHRILSRAESRMVIPVLECKTIAFEAVVIAINVAGV